MPRDAALFSIPPVAMLMLSYPLWYYGCGIQEECGALEVDRLKNAAPGGMRACPSGLPRRPRNTGVVVRIEHEKRATDCWRSSVRMPRFDQSVAGTQVRQTGSTVLTYAMCLNCRFFFKKRPGCQEVVQYSAQENVTGDQETLACPVCWRWRVTGRGGGMLFGPFQKLIDVVISLFQLCYSRIGEYTP